MQIRGTGVFARFDYGNEEENRDEYGTDKAPEIDLTVLREPHMNCPKIALFVGDKDPYGT